MSTPTLGRCLACGTAHRSDFPHQLRSAAYQDGFLRRHGRPPTWADAAAHCPEQNRKDWEDGVTSLGRPWTVPPAGEPPIPEPPDSFPDPATAAPGRRPAPVPG